MKDKTVFLTIEGQPIVSDRRFVLYAAPTVQLGKWQFSLKKSL